MDRDKMKNYLEGKLEELGEQAILIAELASFKKEERVTPFIRLQAAILGKQLDELELLLERIKNLD